MSFLALDGILEWPVKMYDGSWLEWGNLSDEEGILESDSPWRTDNPTYSEVIDPAGATLSDPQRKRLQEVVDSFAPSAKKINEEDKAACSGN